MSYFDYCLLIKEHCRWLFFSLSLSFIAQKQEQNLLNDHISQLSRDFLRYLNNTVKSQCIHSFFFY